jgi:carbonic anhydrase
VDEAAGVAGDRLENAVRINVEHVVRQLRQCKPILETESANGHLKIVGAVYSLDTGKVDWLPSPLQKISPK